MPLALVPIGTLCQAENCSMKPQVIQLEEKPQVGLVACSFLASSNTSKSDFDNPVTKLPLSSVTVVSTST